MKRLYLLFSAFVAALSAMAQDVIVMKNGDLIQSKVQEVTQTEIKYKKFSNPDGPLYTIDKATVLSINYANGEKEMMATGEAAAPAKEESAESDGTPKLVKKAAASNNAELIQKYHPEIKFNLEQKNSDSKFAYPIMAVTGSSILSNDDIEITIEPQYVGSNEFYGNCELKRHYIKIENKTDHVIYVDKANSFKTDNNKISHPYYDDHKVSVTNGSGSGTGVNLGGVAGALGIGGPLRVLAGAVNVGKGSSSSVTETHTSQRILAISPRSAAYLSEYKYVMVKKDESKVLCDAECWEDFAKNLKRGEVKKGECKLYTEGESPYKNEYHITYSNSADFLTYSTINFGVYMRYLVGDNIPPYLSYKSTVERRIKDLQKTIPDYWINKYILIGASAFLEK